MSVRLILLLLIVVVARMEPSGLKILIDSLALLFGTALSLQLVIQAALEVEGLRLLKDWILTIFARLPLALSFGLLVMIGTATAIAEIVLLRDFIAPERSWLWVMLGFLLGIMDAVFQQRKNKRRERNADHGELTGLNWTVTSKGATGR